MTGPKIETTTLVQLDERTKEELQPPCEQRWVVPGTSIAVKVCTEPAEWIVRSRCPVCDKNKARLLCHDDCSAAMIGRPSTCRYCLARDTIALVLSVEPLR